MRKLALLAAFLALPVASGASVLFWNQTQNITTGGGDRRSGSEQVITSVNVSSNDIHAPAAATAAIVTYTGVTGYHCISGIAWSYNTTPTGGNLKIENGSGTTVFSMDIAAAGPGIVYFNQAKRGSLSTNMIVTLASGAGAVVGKVNVLNHWVEYP